MSAPWSTLLAQVPGSTSNLGPGFDTLGLALQIYNFLRLSPVDAPGIVWRGEPAHQEGGTRMLASALRAYGKATGLESATPWGGGVAVEVWGEVPPARGLGSSATLRCGLIAALEHWNGHPLGQDGAIACASRLESAPDNSCASFRGGFVVARLDPRRGHYVGSLRFEVSREVTFTVVSPAYEVSTVESRKVLPPRIGFKDAVRSLNSAAYLTAIFAQGAFERLEHALSDYVNQPYREPLNPFAKEAVRAGREAGAWAGWLSGSGSSVVCIGPEESALEVGKAMASVYQVAGIESRVYRAATDNMGLTVLPEDDEPSA